MINFYVFAVLVLMCFISYLGIPLFYLLAIMFPGKLTRIHRYFELYQAIVIGLTFVAVISGIILLR